MVVFLLAGAACAVVVQCSVLGYWLMQFTENLPNDSELAAASLAPMMTKSAVVALALLFPLLYGFGKYITFRIYGPMYRFRLFLDGVRRGEHPEPCRLRGNDQFQDVCELLNEVTEPLRREQAKEAPAERAA